MERQTCLIPFKSTVGDNTAGLSFNILDSLLVLNLEHDIGGQHIAPVSHHLLIGTIKPAQFPKVVGVRVGISRGKSIEKIERQVLSMRSRQVWMRRALGNAA